ncbi:MAG: hypothetical protein ACTHLW_21215, partial [Verrucomicrobiota bacterium]
PFGMDSETTEAGEELRAIEAPVAGVSPPKENAPDSGTEPLMEEGNAWTLSADAPIAFNRGDFDAK